MGTGALPPLVALAIPLSIRAAPATADSATAGSATDAAATLAPDFDPACSMQAPRSVDALEVRRPAGF